MPEEPTRLQMDMIDAFRERAKLSGFTMTMWKPMPSKKIADDYRLDRWDVHIEYNANKLYAGSAASRSLVKAVRQACNVLVKLVDSDKGLTTAQNAALRSAKLVLAAECARLRLCDNAPERPETDYHTPRTREDPYS